MSQEINEKNYKIKVSKIKKAMFVIKAESKEEAEEKIKKEIKINGFGNADVVDVGVVDKIIEVEEV